MPTRRPKILIVDNDPESIAGIGDVLSSYADTLGATDFPEAIRTLEQDGGISLVISEIRLPGRDGFDLLQWLGEKRPKVQAIMMTAYGSPLIRSLAKQRGAAMYLEKPIDPKQLMDTVRLIVERKGFSVAMEEMELTDLLQFLSFASRAVKVVVTNNIGEEGEIGLQGDRVLWARTGNHSGEAAFFEIEGWEGGRFHLHPLGADEAVPNGEGLSLSYLLLEGARRKDEARLEEFTEGSEEAKGDNPPDPFKEILEGLCRETTDCIAAVVVGIDDGIPIVATSKDPAFDPEVLAAYYAEVIKINEKALKALNRSGNIEELQLMTDAFSLIVRVIPDTRYYLAMAIAKEGNIGMARIAIKRHEKEFCKLLCRDG